MNDATCAGLIECLWKYQTLATGIAAVFAAAITACIIYFSARIPVSAETDRQKESERRRLRLRSLELSEDLKILSRRAIQGQGTVKVHKAANASVTDETRRKMILLIPASTREWEFMSLIPEEVARRCLHLNGMIADHNFDMERAGGAFGDDNFGNSIVTRLAAMSKLAGELSQSFANPDRLQR